MNKINLTYEELNNLKSKKTNIYNSEASIYYHNKHIIKIFYDNVEEKKYTVSLLNRYKKIIQKELSSLVLPEKIVNIDNRFKGYTMPMYVGNNLTIILEDKTIPFTKKIDYLIKLGELLEKLDSVRNNYKGLYNFYLNDLHEDNILITYDNKIKILDTDSVKIADNKAFKSLYLRQPYHSRLYKLSNKYYALDDCIIPNKETDLLCYIYIIINFLVEENISKINFTNFTYYIEKLKQKGVSDDLINIFLNIYEDKPNINPYKILKSATKKLQ